MLSKKAVYAVRALTILAEVAPRPMTTGEIADAGGLPRKFLEAILLDLKKAGVADSVRGREGGYRLARLPEAITVAEIIRAIDGPLALMPCASVTQYAPCADCRDPQACRTRRVFAKGRDALASVLEGSTLADLAGPSSTPLAEAG